MTSCPLHWPDGYESRCASCGASFDDGAGATPPAPAPSLVAGAIGRGLADTVAERHRRQLDELWRDVLAGLPDD